MVMLTKNLKLALLVVFGMGFVTYAKADGAACTGGTDNKVKEVVVPVKASVNPESSAAAGKADHKALDDQKTKN